MTANEYPAVPAARGRALNITLWVVQVFLGLFFIVASAGPKLFGEANAVEIFDQIGAGQWLRYLVGVLELAGGIGLLIPRLAGLAAIGLALLMVGATITQLFILHNALLALTPIVLGVVFVLVAWGRWARTRALLDAVRR
jgi:uncharacterized membrane protein YphA (DoxX/SURF4 family)